MSSIGFAGLGMMGSAMVRRLLTGGYEVHVWNRTAEKTRDLLSEGAVAVEKLEDLIAQHDLVLSMVSTSAVVEEISHAVRTFGARGIVHIDFSTISPRTSAECEHRARDVGQFFVHAPVLGSIPQVNEGSLLIFAGGDRGVIQRIAPVLNALSKKTYTFDEAAKASSMKLACNFFIASMILTLGQGLRFAEASGLDRADLLNVLSQSALAAPMYESKGATILEGTFVPRFLLDHMLKDIRLFRDAADELGLSMPSTAVLEGVFQNASEAGLGTEDYSAVVKVL